MSRDSKPYTTLYHLFYTFLVIGSVSFGGYSSLVSMVKVRMVDREKLISDHIIFESFSIASLLPGPVAVNTVAYIGYYLRGWMGALVSFVAVLIPSFILVVVLTHLYLEYAQLPAISSILKGVTSVILAIIFSVGFKLAKNNILTYRHALVMLLGIGIQIFFKGYLAFIICLVIGGLLGYFFIIDTKNVELKEESKPSDQNPKRFSKYFIPQVVLTSVFIILFFVLVFTDPVRIKILETFGKVSLTLFGGGYVMIPLLEDLLVQKLEWLNTQQFIDAIAIGQVTPGPILISAAFVGYKLQGIIGAIIATLSIFTPSALVMVILANRIEKIKNNHIWNRVMNGIKPIVIAFIFFSIYTIVDGIDYKLFALAIGAAAAFLMIKFNINFIYLLLVAAVIGGLFL